MLLERVFIGFRCELPVNFLNPIKAFLEYYCQILGAFWTSTPKVGGFLEAFSKASKQPEKRPTLVVNLVDVYCICNRSY